MWIENKGNSLEDLLGEDVVEETSAYSGYIEAFVKQITKEFSLEWEDKILAPYVLSKEERNFNNIANYANWTNLSKTIRKIKKISKDPVGYPDDIYLQLRHSSSDQKQGNNDKTKRIKY